MLKFSKQKFLEILEQEKGNIARTAYRMDISNSRHHHCKDPEFHEEVRRIRERHNAHCSQYYSKNKIREITPRRDVENFKNRVDIFLESLKNNSINKALGEADASYTWFYKKMRKDKDFRYKVDEAMHCR